MTFNLNFATSATISANTVEEMVRASVEQQTGQKVERVVFKTASKSNYMDRCSHTVFDGCVVYFKNEGV